MNNDTTDSVFLPEERSLAVSIVCFVSSLGFLGHLASLLLIAKNKEAQHAFGYLCLLNSAGSLGLTAIFVLYPGLIMLFSIENIPLLFKHKIGQLTCFVYYINIYTHLAKGINRFLAISYPVYYKTVFSPHSTKIVMSVVLIICFCHSMPHFFDAQGCYFYFDEKSLLWFFGSTPCGDALGYYVDFILTMIETSSCFVLDLITLTLF